MGIPGTRGLTLDLVTGIVIVFDISRCGDDGAFNDMPGVYVGRTSIGIVLVVIDNPLGMFGGVCDVIGRLSMVKVFGRVAFGGYVSMVNVLGDDRPSGWKASIVKFLEDWGPLPPIMKLFGDCRPPPAIMIFLGD